MIYRIGRDFLLRHPRWTTGVLGSLMATLPQGLRYGRKFRETRRLLQASQWWSREQLENYQLGRLRETLEYAYAEIPYYKESFDQHGVRPEQLRNLDDIRRFPTLNKELLLENIDRIQSPKMDRKRLMEFCTGGTSGSGVMLYFEERFRQREQAFIWHLWNRVGYHHTDLAAILQHRHCPEQENDGYWYMEKAENAMILSAHRLHPNTIHHYLEALGRHRPKVLIAYPSLAHLFATYAADAGWNEKIFDLVLCGSETLYDYQRSHLEAVFKAPVRIHYGHIESCALFGYCVDSNRYHVQMEYGYVEFFRRDGSVAEEDDTAEIVATSFDNLAVPLIRYQTRDWAQLGRGQCSCGRNYPLVDRIEGREGDFIRTPSGKWHSPTLIEFHVDGTVGFEDLQIVQERPDEAIVKVVPGSRFTQEELNRFCRALTEEFEHEIHIRSEIVDNIPRTWSQKKSLIISHLPQVGDHPMRGGPGDREAKLE